jgi:hypothetical protein
MTGGAAAVTATPVVIGSADGPSTTIGSQAPANGAPPTTLGSTPGPADALPTTAATTRASSPGQQALLAQAGSVPDSAIRNQVTVETEGRIRVEPALFDHVVAQAATSGPGTPDVVSRDQTPIDF